MASLPGRRLNPFESVYKFMLNDNLTYNWIFYDWTDNHGVDHLIHPDDLIILKGHVYGLGLAYCVEDSGNDYIKIKSKLHTVRVKKSGVKRIVPSPAYIWGQISNDKIEAR